MCSVIEIKNADEYYIRYHSPESMDTNGKEDDKAAKKPEEVTSDRCSSAESTLGLKQKDNACSSEDGNTTSCTSGHQSDIARTTPSKSPTTDEEIIRDLVKNKLLKTAHETDAKDGVPQEVTSDRGSSAGSSTDEAESKRFEVMKPADKADQNAEKVPITVNSHIPASPQRLVKATTPMSDAGTQMESIGQQEKQPSDNQTKSLDEKAPGNQSLNESPKKENVTEEIERKRKASENERIKVEGKNPIIVKRETLTQSGVFITREVSTIKKESISKLPVFLQDHQRPVVKSPSKSSIPVLTANKSPVKKKTSILKKVSSMSSKDSKKKPAPPTPEATSTKPLESKPKEEKSPSRKLSLRKEKNKEKDPQKEVTESKNRDKSTKKSFLKKRSPKIPSSDTETLKDSGEADIKVKKKPRSSLDKKMVKKCLSMDRIDQMFHKKTSSENRAVIDPLNLHHPRFHKPARGVDFIRDGTSSVVSASPYAEAQHIVKKTKDGYVVFGPGKKWSYANGKQLFFALAFAPGINKKAFYKA